jgi:hypothetical protein
MTTGSSPKVLGLRTTYTGSEHPYLNGIEVVVVAVLKDALVTHDGLYLTTDEAVSAAGGVGPDDRVEVQPILPDGQQSFVSSDPKAVELDCFRSLSPRPEGAPS